MNFAGILRQQVEAYNDSIDENLISCIKRKCEEAAKNGKSYTYIDDRLSQATKNALKEREGLNLVIASTSCYTYQINW